MTHEDKEKYMWTIWLAGIGFGLWQRDVGATLFMVMFLNIAWNMMALLNNPEK